jgi:hypothetical protein
MSLREAFWIIEAMPRMLYGVPKNGLTRVKHSLLKRSAQRVGEEIFLFLMLFAMSAAAQQLEPRAYSASPIGTSFAVLVFGRSSGDVSFDPSIPVTNVHATLYSPGLGVGQTFGFFGRQALFTAVLPYVWGTATGDVGEQQGSVYRSGTADIRTKISVNLRGNPAQNPQEFARRHNRDFIIGTSLTVIIPSGQYDATKLINLGTNRWSLKPEIGFSWPVKKFYLDLYTGIWFYTANASFYPRTVNRTQSPLTAIQGHVSYTVRRGLWAAVDATWYGGAATRSNGGAPMERQENSRIGATISLPASNRQSIKVAYSSGVSGTIGSKFDTISVGWQYTELDRRH